MAEFTTVERQRPAEMPFHKLIRILKKSLPSERAKKVKILYKDYQEKKIRSRKLIRRLRRLVGDEILTFIIRNFKDKDIIEKVAFAFGNPSTT